MPYQTRVGGEVLSKRDRREVKRYTKEMRFGQEALTLIGWTRNSGKVTSRRVWVQCSSSILTITHKIKDLGRCLTCLLVLALILVKLCLLFTNMCLAGFTTDFKRMLAVEYPHFRRQKIPWTFLSVPYMINPQNISIKLVLEQNKGLENGIVWCSPTVLSICN